MTCYRGNNLGDRSCSAVQIKDRFSGQSIVQSVRRSFSRIFRLSRLVRESIRRSISRCICICRTCQYIISGTLIENLGALCIRLEKGKWCDPELEPENSFHEPVFSVNDMRFVTFDDIAETVIDDMEKSGQGSFQRLLLKKL